MLVEIWCDRFMDGGEPRGPVRFRKGLNAVLGGGCAQNSIGKSTFLMIIDFVFCGLDYVTADGGVTGRVGVHEIRFCFQFGEDRFYFSRSTGNHGVVQRCSEAYEPFGEMSLLEYSRFLAERYGVDQPGADFRDMVDGYFRIHGRNNYDARRPLAVSPRDRQEEGIRRLLQLFQKYDRVEEMRSALKEEERRARAYRDAFSYRFIPGVTGKMEYEKNRERISALTEMRDGLVKQRSQGIWDGDSMQAERLADARRDLRMIWLQEQQIRYQMDGMKADMNMGNRKASKGFVDLLEFFPDADIRNLESIEAFHDQIKRVLQPKYDDTKRSLQAMLRSCSFVTELIEQQVKGTEDGDQAFQEILERYSEIDREIRDLKEANGYFDRMEAMKREIAGLRGDLECLMETLQNDINLALERLNAFVSDGQVAPPSIVIKGMTKYTYQAPSEGGIEDGSRVMGMLLFDLVMLEKTVLPAVIYDSNSIREVEDSAMMKIMELYDAQPKQVFIAVDEEDMYSDSGALPEVLRDAVVLRLSPGHELFGWAWDQPGARGCAGE